MFEGMLFAAYYQFRVLAYFEGVFSAPATTSYFVNGVTGKGLAKFYNCMVKGILLNGSDFEITFFLSKCV